MELEVSRGTVFSVAVALSVGVLVLLGGIVTPTDGDGEPLVLSPSYVATRRYLRTTQGWLEKLGQVNADLADVAEGGGNFFNQGRDAERAFEAVLAIARSVEQTRTPPSLTALQTAFSRCAAAYVGAARSVLAYVSAPSEDNQQVVGQELKVADDRLDACRAVQEGVWPRP